MEIIEVSGYITEEKYEIAKRHLIPRELENTGLKATSMKPTFNKAAIEMIIERYTRESGVRQLEKQINKSLRKIAYKRQLEDNYGYQKITPAEIEDLLGKPPFYRDIYQGNDYAGVVTGLAWTSVGGEILFIETSLSKGKGFMCQREQPRRTVRRLVSPSPLPSPLPSPSVRFAGILP